MTLTWHIGGTEPTARSWSRITRKPRLFLGTILSAHLQRGPATAAELSRLTGRPVLAVWASLRSMEGQGRTVRNGDLWRRA